MEKLKYFVYTSGEAHDGQVDWAAKFVSDEFPLPNGSEIHDSDSHASLTTLSNAYTENVARFGLSGGLVGHRPDGDGFGYIVLPWNEKYTLVGIYANFADLMKRANIGLVLAAVPKDVRKHMSPAETISAILKDNDIRRIAAPRHSEEERKASPRPKRLLLDDSGSVKDIDSSLKKLDGMGWPARGNAFILTDGKIQKFKGEEPEVRTVPVAPEKTTGKGTPKKKKTSMGLLVGGLIAIALIVGVVCISGHSPSKNKGTQSSTTSKISRKDMEKAKQVEEEARKREEAERQKFEELASDVIKAGDDGAFHVFGVAMLTQTGEKSYVVQHSLGGRVPAKFDAFPEGFLRLDTPETGDYIVNPAEVQRKLTDALSSLKYLKKDSSDSQPVYNMTQEEWDQTLDDIGKLCQEYSINAGDNGQIFEDVYQKKLSEELQKDGELQIGFFGRPNGISQSLRIVRIDEEKNLRPIESYVVKVGENIVLTPEARQRWNDRFITGEKRNPPIPAMQFIQAIGALKLYVGDLKELAEEDEEKIKEVFVDQMIDALK